MGAIASDLGALFTIGAAWDAAVAAAVSLVSALLHVRFAAQFRERHVP